jgi:hypothetical protein
MATVKAQNPKSPIDASRLTLEQLSAELAHCVTRYDRMQQEKAERNPKFYYNEYALGIYLGRCENVIDSVSKGESLEAAITSGFNDRLRDHILKWFGFPKFDAK